MRKKSEGNPKIQASGASAAAQLQPGTQVKKRRVGAAATLQEGRVVDVTTSNGMSVKAVMKAGKEGQF